MLVSGDRMMSNKKHTLMEHPLGDIKERKFAIQGI